MFGEKFMNFSENLKNIRSGVGITQKSLGDKIGVTAVTIGNWERGIRLPSFDLLPKLADALGISIDTLFEKNGVVWNNQEEEDLIRKYRRIDSHGRKLVRIVCDAEFERICASNSRAIRFPEERLPGSNRYIPFYLTASAAGMAVPLDGAEFEMLLVDDSVPADADYAVRISGDSMKPYINDGEMVFVKETQNLHNGDVGIFCVDGAMYCKQYHVDENRNLHLLSANPDRANTNVYVGVDSESSVKCCGKVLTGNSIPLPDYFK